MTIREQHAVRPALRLVERADPRESPLRWFCGHCAAPPPGHGPTSLVARVCSACGLGLMLETHGDVTPAPGDAFLVVDALLRVQAISRGGEALLAVSEAAAIPQPLTSLLALADAEADPAGFAAAIHAALHADEVVSCFVRPWNTFGVRMRARVAACAPPRAALIVLDTSPRRLHAVADVPVPGRS